MNSVNVGVIGAGIISDVTLNGYANIQPVGSWQFVILMKAGQGSRRKSGEPRVFTRARMNCARETLDVDYGSNFTQAEYSSLRSLL